MSEPAHRRAIYADLEALPSNVVGEILHGVLHVMPRPAPRHALGASVINQRVGSAFHGPNGLDGGGWWILMEPELHLGEHVVVPDLAGWRRERLPRLPDEAYFTMAPDWVCEVLSPGTETVDRAEKMPIYASFSVKHAWLLDPIARYLELWILEQGRLVQVPPTHRDSDVVNLPPFEALSLELDVLWAD